MLIEKDEKLLNTNQWMVECDTPLEIRHLVSDEFLSGKEAKEVLKKLKIKKGSK